MTVHKNGKLLVIVTVLSKCQIINHIDCLPKCHTTSMTIPLPEDLTSSIRHLDGGSWATLWVDPLEVSSEPSFFWECRFSKYLFDSFSIIKRKCSKYVTIFIFSFAVLHSNHNKYDYKYIMMFPHQYSTKTLYFKCYQIILQLTLSI
jgi:hypothetical protein